MSKVLFLFLMTLIWWIDSQWLLVPLVLVMSVLAIFAFGRKVVFRGLPFAAIAGLLAFGIVYLVEFYLGSGDIAGSSSLAAGGKWFTTLLPIHYVLSGELADDLLMLAIYFGSDRNGRFENGFKNKQFDPIILTCGLGVPLYWGWIELTRLREARVYWRERSNPSLTAKLEDVLVDFVVGMISRWQAALAALSHRGFGQGQAHETKAVDESI